jgi:hypothetical protein
MPINLYLAKLERRGSSEVILGFYKQEDGWQRIRGESIEEFVKNVDTNVRLEGEDIIFKNIHINYFSTMIPVPNTLPATSYDQLISQYTSRKTNILK